MMTKKTALFLVAVVVSLGGLALAFACSSSPSAPKQDPPPPPGSGGTAVFNVTVTSSRPNLSVGSTEAAEIVIRVRRADNGAAPANGSLVTVQATLGEFNEPGSGLDQITATLINGVANVLFFAGNETGTAVIRANFQGNVGQTSIDLLAGAAFFLSFVEPDNGKAGDVVTVHGGGFERPMQVLFDNISARVVSSGPSRVRVEVPTPVPSVPAGQTRAVNVAVSIRLDSSEQESSTLQRAFTYAPGGGPVNQPLILSVDPPSGPNEGGTRVTLTGEGFVAPVQVLFGSGSSSENFQGVEATVESVTPTRIVVLSPPAGGFAIDNRNQLVDLLVRNLDSGFSGLIEGAFQYLTPFNISGISPLEVPATEPRLVSIFGSGFRDPLQVTVGAIGSSEEIEQRVVSVAPAEVVFETTPSVIDRCPSDGVVRRGKVNVRLLDTGPENPSPGTVVSSQQELRFVVPVPRILDITPDSGPQGGGTAVTIIGENFDTPAQVSFFAKGEKVIGDVTSVTPTRINARTPSIPSSLLDTESCDDNGDGTEGTRFLATAFDVVVELLDTTCTFSFPNGFIFTPTDGSCRNDVGPVEPAEPPVAEFTFEINGLTVIFNDASTGGAATDIRWNFGDGSPIATGPSVSHTYAAAGTFVVTLTVANTGGTDAISKFVTVP